MVVAQPGATVSGELRLVAHARQSYDVYATLRAPPLAPGGPMQARAEGAWGRWADTNALLHSSLIALLPYLSTRHAGVHWQVRPEGALLPPADAVDDAGGGSRHPRGGSRHARGRRLQRCGGGDCSGGSSGDGGRTAAHGCQLRINVCFWASCKLQIVNY